MTLDAAMHDYDLRAVPEYARKVEAIGYDCLWTSETQHDPFLPLAVATTATSSIKLGTSIAVAFPRSPSLPTQLGTFKKRRRGDSSLDSGRK